MKKIYKNLLIAITSIVFISLIYQVVKKKDPQKAEVSNSKALNIHLPSKLKSMDPVTVGDHYTAKVVFNVYESLYTYSHIKSGNVIIPLLAESLPELSEDRLTYTIKLKQGVCFQNDTCFKDGVGREVKAQDFVNSIGRIAVPTLNCPVFRYFKDIKGFEEFYEQAKKGGKGDYTKDIEGLEAIDEYTLRITLKKPCPLFLGALALGNASVVPQEAIDAHGEEFNRNLVGTGPYYVENYDPMSSKIVLERNPTYRNDVFPAKDEIDPEFKRMLPYAGKRLPLMDKVIFSVIPQQSSANLKFMKGELDINDQLSSEEDTCIIKALPEYPDFSEHRNKFISGHEVVLKGKNREVHLKEGYDLSAMYINMSYPDLKDNTLLRAAMSTGFNRQRVINKISNGNGKLVHPINIPGYEDYDPDYKHPNFCYDVKKAKELLEKAGHPGGEGLEEIVILVSNDTRKKIAEFFKADMEKIGITIKIEQMDFNRMLERTGEKGNNTWGIVICGWSPDVNSILDFEKLFYSKNIGGCNRSRYNNSEYDKLYEKVTIMDDIPERTKVRKKMRDIIAENVPVLSIWSREGLILCQPSIRNYRYTEFNYTTLKYFDKVAGKPGEVAGVKPDANTDTSTTENVKPDADTVEKADDAVEADAGTTENVKPDVDTAEKADDTVEADAGTTENVKPDADTVEKADDAVEAATTQVEPGEVAGVKPDVNTDTSTTENVEPGAGTAVEADANTDTSTTENVEPGAGTAVEADANTDTSPTENVEPGADTVVEADANTDTSPTENVKPDADAVEADAGTTENVKPDADTAEKADDTVEADAGTTENVKPDADANTAQAPQNKAKNKDSYLNWRSFGYSD